MYTHYIFFMASLQQNSPQSVRSEEGDVERLFFRVVFEGHQHSIAEPNIRKQLQTH